MLETAPVASVAAVAALAALLLAVGSDATRWTVPATGPWVVAAAAAVVAARTDAYDPVRALVPALPTAAVAAVAGLAAVSWVATGRLAAARGLPYRERYLAAAGTGAAVVLLSALVGRLGVPAGRLLFAVGVVLATAAVAAAGLVAVGLRFGSLLTDLRLAGLYAVWTVVLEGVASVVAGGVPTGPFAPAVRRAFVAAGVAPTWPAVVAAHLAVGLAVVAVCGRLARWRTGVGRGAVLVVSAAALWSGTVALLAVPY